MADRKKLTKLKSRLVESDSEEQALPPKKGATKKRVEDSDDIAAPATQKGSAKATQTQTQAAAVPDDSIATQINISAQNLNELNKDVREHVIASVVRLFLFNEAKKAPTKRADITSGPLKDFKDKKLTSAAIDEARKKLLQVFGFEVVEMEKGLFILRSSFRPENFSPEFLHEFSKSLSEREKNERGLLIIALSLIFINNNSITQEALLRYVEAVGFGEASESSWWVNAIVKTFVSQKYLVKKKEKGTDSERIVYSIGARSLQEIGKKRILVHVAQILGQDIDQARLKEIEAELAGGVPDEDEDKEEEAGEEPPRSQVLAKKSKRPSQQAEEEEEAEVRAPASKKAKK